MGKKIEFKSNFEKRFELINAIFEIAGHVGSADEWLEKRSIKLEDLTYSEIDKLVRVINDSKGQAQETPQ